MKCPKVVMRNVHGSRKPKAGPCGLAIEIKLLPYNHSGSVGVDIEYRCTALHVLPPANQKGLPATLTEVEELVNKLIGD